MIPNRIDTCRGSRSTGMRGWRGPPQPGRSAVARSARRGRSSLQGQSVKFIATTNHITENTNNTYL